MAAADALVRLADFAKADGTYTPRKCPGSTRWHARVDSLEYEIICTGPRFFDTRARVGGGGALDLAIHLLDGSFRDAVKFLRAKGL